MKKSQHALRVQLGWGAQCAKKPVINIYYDLVLRICMGNVCFFPMSDPNVDSIHVGVTVIEYGSNGQQKKRFMALPTPNHKQPETPVEC
jgi:hypothetical protein